MLISIGMSDSISPLIFGTNAYAIAKAKTMHATTNPSDSDILLMITPALLSPWSILVAISLLLLPESAELRLM